MPEYTVKAAMKTGKSSQTYGVEYYVQFEETEASFPMWFKKEPEVGQKIDGNIEGSKFKKVKKEWKPNENTGGNAPTTSVPSKRGYQANTDGIRVGMCINNASAYINTLEFKAALTDREWAELVVSYAKALYAISEFNKEITPEKVSEVFNGAS